MNNDVSSSLANGAALTPETFADFIDRLRHHCIGLGVSEHGTADALFVVQARRFVTGIDLEFAEKQVAIVDNDSIYFLPEGFIQEEGERYGIQFKSDEIMDYQPSELWDLIREIAASDDSVIVTGLNEAWEYVNCHFTKEAADAFIKRKSHDYPLGLRVFVDSQINAWEFNAIKNALLSGELILRKGA